MPTSTPVVDAVVGASAMPISAATLVGRAADFATHLVNLRAGAGALLEYLPDPVVPFRGSRLFQRVCVDARSGVDGDPWRDPLAGTRRARRGSRVRRLLVRDRGADPHGTLLFADILRLDPAGGHDPKSIGLLDIFDVVATLYVVTGRMRPVAMVALLRQALGARSDVISGVSELPNDCGAAVRLLGPSSRVVKAAMRTAWEAARLALLGIPAPNLRKG